MEHKVKILDLLQSPQAFQELRGLKLPAKQSYWIAKLARQIDAVLKDYHEAYMARITQFREGLPDGVELPKEKLDALNAELKVLQEEEAALEFTVLPLSLFDGMKVSTDLFLGLEWLIKDEPEGPPPQPPMPAP